MCAGERSGLELHPATSSPSSRQDYWHRISLPLAEIARTQGQSTRIWELPWALLVRECVLFVCARVFVCVVFTWVSTLYKWSWFPPRCWARSPGKNMSSLLFLTLSHTHTHSLTHTHTHKHTHTHAQPQPQFGARQSSLLMERIYCILSSPWRELFCVSCVQELA